MRFEFATAQRIIFGPGAVADLPRIAAAFGKRALVVTGRDKIRRAGLVGELESVGFACALFGVPAEPTVALAREGVEYLRACRADVVIAIGGGSAIDAGKAISALAANPGDVLDYLGIVGRGRPLTEAPVPFIAVPTTSGTGAEVTRNAVLGSNEHGVKASLRSPLMLPRVALVDPDLTLGLPRDVTAATGLDALTQLIEPFVSNRANPMTDGFCREGIPVAFRNLPTVCAEPGNAEARAGMSYASLLGGLALANAGLGVVHGFAAPIGGMFDAPHGAVCAALLPHGVRANIAALRGRAPESAALGRYAELSRMLTGRGDSIPEDVASCLDRLVAELGIPPLRKYGVTEGDVPVLVEKAARAGSMKANPVELTAEELESVVSAAI